MRNKNKLKQNTCLTLGFVLFMLSSGFTQQADSARMSVPRYESNTAVNAAALGAIIYPGFSIGIERPYKTIQKQILKKKSTKFLIKNRLLSYNLSMYHQRDFHTNLMGQASWTTRRIRQKGWYREFSIGAGLSRTFLAGPTYSVDESGIIDRVPLAGNWYGLFSSGVAFGIDYMARKQKPYAIFLKHQWYAFFPHNSFITLRPTLELGVSFQMNDLWKATPSKVYIQKARRNVYRTL